MTDTRLRFRHEVIDPDPPGSQHDITLIADINGDGRNEIVIGGKQGPPNLFWYESGTWARHAMADAPELEAGGVVVDLTGSGRLDVVAGQQAGGSELYWFENPPEPTQPWPRRVIEDRFCKYHDQAVGDVNNDGADELVVLSQRARVLVYYDIPSDPRVEPWPRDCCHVIADGFDEEIEGLRIADVDGDGRSELLAGPHVYRVADGRVELVATYAPGYRQTRIALGDFRGCGRPQVAVSEGESHPARLAVFDLDGAERILRDDLFHPHSLEVADFTGDGRPDLFVAEMGLGRNPNPRMFVYLNRGGGEFEEVCIQQGVAVHEAKVGDLTGDGRPDIVGKPYDPQRHIDVWFNES